MSLIRIRLEVYGPTHPGVVIEDQKTGLVHDPTKPGWVPPDGPTLSDAMVNKIAAPLVQNQPNRGRWGATLNVTDDDSIGRIWNIFPFDLPALAPGAAPTTPPVPLGGMQTFTNDRPDWCAITAAKI